MFDTFLMITDGPKGESTDKQFPGQMAIRSFDFGVTNNSKITSDAPGSGAGKPTLSGINFTRNIDGASPLLYQACCLGSHFSQATVNVRKSGGAQYVYMTITMTEVYITSYSCSGSEGSEIPFESFTITFASIKYDYTPQTVAGAESGSPPPTTTYDLTKNAKV
jgi:type VI secretion system secreted protein Hcp